MSKKSNAINALNQLLSELENITNPQQGNTWKAALGDLLLLYVGPGSTLLERLSDLYFTKREDHSNRDISFTTHVFKEEKKQNFRELINKAISHINANGLYKDPNKKNFLANLTNVEMISSVGGVLLLTLYAGIFIGNMQKDRDILSAENKLREMEEKYNKCQNQITVLEGLNKKMQNVH